MDRRESRWIAGIADAVLFHHRSMLINLDTR